MTILDEYLEEIQAVEEASKRTTITKVTRQTKIDRAIGSLSTQFAKRTNDPLYDKMIRYRKKFFKFREMIRKKYAPRVRSRAISGKGISDMLKDKKRKK